MAQQTELTPARAKELISGWLSEEGWQVHDQTEPGGGFHLGTVDVGGWIFEIHQVPAQAHRVTLVTGASFGETKEQLAGLLAEMREEVFRALRMELYRMDCVVVGEIQPGAEVLRFADVIYYDALTQDVLMRRLLHLKNAALLVSELVKREVGSRS